MEMRSIGKNGLRVSAVSFGCARIGNLYRAVSDQTANDVLETAWNLGIRYFDTAPHYGRGRSEQLLGRFLCGRARDSFVVSSKAGRLLSPGAQTAEVDGFVDPLPNDVRYDYSGEGIEASFEQSCERLGLNKIDILYVHDIGKHTHGADNARHMLDLHKSGLDRLSRLKAKGRISAFGLGVNEVQVCVDIITDADIEVILLAGRLTLLDRSAEARLVPLCQARGVGLVLGGIFSSGILATGPVPGATYDYAPASEEVVKAVRQLQVEAQAQGRSLAEMALRFCYDHPSAASILLGTANPASLIRNFTELNLPTGVAKGS